MLRWKSIAEGFENFWIRVWTQKYEIPSTRNVESSTNLRHHISAGMSGFSYEINSGNSKNLPANGVQNMKNEKLDSVCSNSSLRPLRWFDFQSRDPSPAFKLDYVNRESCMAPTYLFWWHAKWGGWRWKVQTGTNRFLLWTENEFFPFFTFFAVPNRFYTGSTM